MEEASDDDDDNSGDETENTALPAENSESVSVPKTQNETVAASNGSGIFSTKLYALIGEEKIEGAVNAESGKPLAFEIGGWVDEYGRNINVSGATVFVNDEPIESADISDEGRFILPGGIMSGEITVYVSAQTEGREIRTLEVNAVTEEETAAFSDALSDNNGNKEGNAGGCIFSLLGVAGLIFCASAILRRK